MSQKKRNLARENEIRRIDTERKRAERVMLGYIKTLHPNVYNEAEKYYTGLSKRHPARKDLTKTAEYRSLAKDKIAVMGNFELRIELMDHGTTTRATTTTTTTPAAETATPMAPEITPEPPAETAPAPSQEITLNPEGEPMPSLPLLDEETLQQLISDLRQDPVMADFFDDIDFQIDNCPLW